MATGTNILFIMTDQHRVDTLGCYGNPTIDTPAIDSLADSGTRLDRMYTPSAICAPARASLLTGLYPFRHGLLSNFEWNSGHREELPQGLHAFSTTLRDNGYNLGHVGKWHVGKSQGPGAFGFDGVHLPGPLNTYGHQDYLDWLSTNGHPPFSVTDPINGVLQDSQPGHLLAARLNQPTDATFEAYLTERSLQFVEQYASDWQADGTPFFLSCHYFGPHLPYVLPDEWFDRYDPADVPLPHSMAETFAGKPVVQQTYSRYWSVDHFGPDEWRKLIAIYWGYVAMIDQQIGRLVDRLHELGLWEATTIVFTADHGEFTGAHRLNDKGPAMYEDIYRIPGIVRVPNHSRGVVDDFTTLIDLNATILDLAGIPGHDKHDGRSLLPFIRGEDVPDWRQEVVAEFHGHHFPYAQRMIRDRRFKLVINPESVNELYDLELDPDELHNVYDTPAYAAARRDLSQRLYNELRNRGDKFYQWISFMGDLGDEERVQLDTSVEMHVELADERE